MSARPFRFAPLLDWAEQREEQQSVAFAAAARVEQAAFETLQMLVAERERQIALVDGGCGVIDPESRQVATAYIEFLDRQIEAQEQAVGEAHAQAEVERSALLDVSREKRSLEHLRDRDEERAAEAAERREAGEVDGLNMSRHARRSMGGT